AILIAWWGNRNWTFAGRRSAPTAGARSRELVQFIAVNLVGMAIGVGCLAVSHYLLGLTSPLADNISANGVGLVLGTVFRYVAYRYWVFTADDGDGPPPPVPREEAPHRDPAASEPRWGRSRRWVGGAEPAPAVRRRRLPDPGRGPARARCHGRR